MNRKTVNLESTTLANDINKTIIQKKCTLNTNQYNPTLATNPNHHKRVKFIATWEQPFKMRDHITTQQCTTLQHKHAINYKTHVYFNNMA